jgi:polysaccharide export outer membrane protein
MKICGRGYIGERMRATFRGKKGVKAVAVLIFLCISFLGGNSEKAFAQGKEWERMRSGTYLSSGAFLPGEKTQLAEYVLSPGDIVEVFVWENPDLSKDITIGPDGKISYPLVGRIRAAGLTLGQLEEEMKARFSEYVRYPQVSLILKKSIGNKIIVLGEVNYPGVYGYAGSIDLVSAIALAGDFTEAAREDSVMIVRGIATDSPEVLRMNMIQMLNTGKSNAYILLEPDDVVYVPKSFIDNFNKFLSKITPTLSMLLDAYGVFDVSSDEIRRATGRKRPRW